MRRESFVVSLLLVGSALSAGAPPAAPEPGRKLVDWSYQCMHTLADLRSVRSALQEHLIDHGTLPKVSSIEEVRKLIEPMYIQTAVLVDAWGTPFALDVSADGKRFRVASAGSDLNFERESWDRPGLLSSSKEDAVLGTSTAADREWRIQ